MITTDMVKFLEPERSFLPQEARKRFDKASLTYDQVSLCQGFLVPPLC